MLLARRPALNSRRSMRPFPSVSKSLNSLFTRPGRSSAEFASSSGGGRSAAAARLARLACGEEDEVEVDERWRRRRRRGRRSALESVELDSLELDRLDCGEEDEVEVDERWRRRRRRRRRSALESVELDSLELDRLDAVRRLLRERRSLDGLRPLSGCDRNPASRSGLCTDISPSSSGSAGTLAANVRVGTANAPSRGPASAGLDRYGLCHIGG